MTGGCGGREPKFPCHFLAYIADFSAVLADFSFRQLPSAFVSFRGIPSPRLLCMADDMAGGDGGPGAKVPGPLFSLNCSFQCCFG